MKSSRHHKTSSKTSPIEIAKSFALKDTAAITGLALKSNRRNEETLGDPTIDHFVHREC